MIFFQKLRTKVALTYNLIKTWKQSVKSFFIATWYLIQNPKKQATQVWILSASSQKHLQLVLDSQLVNDKVNKCNKSIGIMKMFLNLIKKYFLDNS